MAPKKSQKVQNSTKTATVKPAKAKEAMKDVANAAKKASHKLKAMFLGCISHPLVSNLSRLSVSAAKAPQVSIDTDNSKDEEIAKLRAENNKLRQNSAAATSNNNELKIPHPTIAKKLQLQEVMGLTDDPDFFNAIRRSVRFHVSHAGLNPSLGWHEQPKDEIVKICQLAQKDHPYLKHFPHNWATEEFIKRLMKNRREYGHRLVRKAEKDVNVPNDNGDKESDDDEGNGANEGNGADD